MIEATTSKNETPFDRLMLILCGAEKSGKSRTAATARKPILFHDWDKRRQSLAGIDGVYVLTYTDEQWPKMPTAFNDHLSVLTMLEQKATLKTIGERFGIKDWPDVRPRTQVEDSLASMGKSAMSYALYSNAELRRELAVGGAKVFMPKNWDSWNAESESVYQAVMRIVAQPDQDLILIFHETDQETGDSTAEKPKFTGKKDLYPARYRIFNRTFSEVWRVSREMGGVVPTIQVIPDFRFTASSNLDFSKLQPADYVPPNIAALIKKATGKD